MTASMVLNSTTSVSRVSQATRDRVIIAAEKLSYRRNAVAHGLSRRRMDSIGVVASIDGGELNLYFLEVLNGILEAAAEHDQNTTIISISSWQKDDRKILQFCDGRVDGLVLIAPFVSHEFAAKLPRHTPSVSIHSNIAMENTYNLGVDEEAGAYAIVKYLIDLGHHSIMHFAGPNDLTGAQLRKQGYCRALYEAGIPYDSRLVLDGVYSFNSGFVRASQLLQGIRPDPFPTAIFCASDAIASGCIEGLTSAQFRVPDDISLAGFDDTLMARITSPNLTTVRQPFRQMGRRAVDVLVQMIRWELEPENEQHTNLDAEQSDYPQMLSDTFQTELVIRKSTGPPRK